MHRVDRSPRASLERERVRSQDDRWNRSDERSSERAAARASLSSWSGTFYKTEPKG
jgi:hypothetical protein